MIIVSYYTDERYRRASLVMRGLLDRFGYAYEVDAVPDLGVHLRNRQFKATFIKQKRTAHPGEDVCWMDVDLRMQEEARLLRTPPPGDVGLTRCGLEFWSSLIYFRATPGADAFVDAWIQAHLDHPLDSDLNLKYAVRSSGAQIWEWPETYVWYPPTCPYVFPGRKPVMIHDCLSQVT